MAIKKQYYKTKPYCKVTFRLSKKEAGNAGKVSIAGDFNDWKSERTPMKALKNGDFTATVLKTYAEPDDEPLSSSKYAGAVKAPRSCCKQILSVYCTHQSRSL